MYFSRVVLVLSVFLIPFSWLAFKHPELFIHGRRSTKLTRLIGEEASKKLAKYVGVPLVLMMAGVFIGIGIDHEITIHNAEKGDAAAQYELADHFYRGDFQAEDFETAIYWYKQSATGGSTHSQVSLGFLYLEHFRDDPDRMREAKKLFLEASFKNESEGLACYGMGYMLQYGIAQKPDPLMAFVLYSLAAERGSRLGQQQLDFLASRLSPEQLQSARKDLAALHVHYAKVGVPGYAETGVSSGSGSVTMTGPVETNTVVRVTRSNDN